MWTPQADRSKAAILRTTVELIAYPADHVQVACSRVVGTPGKRTIVQVSELMFNDIEEAKDAVDMILDRLNVEAQSGTALAHPEHLAAAEAPRDTPRRRSR